MSSKSVKYIYIDTTKRCTIKNKSIYWPKLVFIAVLLCLIVEPINKLANFYLGIIIREWKKYYFKFYRHIKVFHAKKILIHFLRKYLKNIRIV